MDQEQIDNASLEELDAMMGDVPQTEEAVAPEPKPDTPAEPEAEAELSLEDRLKKVEADNARYQKQLKDKDDFINQRNAEIGLLRKQTREKQAKDLEVEEPTADEILHDPKAAVRKAIEVARKREELEKEQQTEMLDNLKSQNREVLTRLVPDFEDIRKDIIEVMVADKVPEELRSQFESDPSATLHPSIIFQLSKRAALTRRVAELEAQLAEAESRPGKIVDKITKFGNSRTPAAKPVPEKSNKKLSQYTEQDIDSMSLAELERLEKEL